MDLSPSDWAAKLAQHADAHMLQTAEWGDLKSRFGWSASRLALDSCGAQVLFRRFAPGLTLGYIPRGPFGDWFPKILPHLDEMCKAQGCFALKIEPDWRWDANRLPSLEGQGLLRSPHTVQPARTLIVDLRGSEDQILARMQQKTRYNIRLAGRKGVTVRPWDDIPGFAAMMQQTASRDRFGAHVAEYYRLAYDLFHPNGGCELLVAEFESQPLAAIMVFSRGTRAWYFYGASTDLHRNRMPNHLLQWEAMRWARARGCETYDLWGVPDEDLETLEAGFTQRRDGLWGVYRFKRGFGGQLVRMIGAWDRPYKPMLYRIYRRLLASRTGGG